MSQSYIGGYHDECRSCPYSAEDIERRIAAYGEDDYQPEYVWCDKVGGKHYMGGWCSEALYPERKIFTVNQTKKSANRGERLYLNKKKDAKLREIVNNFGYAPHIGYFKLERVNGEWVEDESHVIRSGRSGTQRSIKKITSKKVRRYKDLPSGRAFRKLVDFWNIMY